MTHLLRHNPHPCQPFLRKPRRARWKFLLLPPVAGLVLACASCSSSSAPEPPPVPVTDTQPVGEGLKVIGYAMLGAAVVFVLGKMMIR